VAPTESVELEAGLYYLSHGERLGKVFRRHHAWLGKAGELAMETSDLVDRRPAEVRRLFTSSGFRVLETKHLDLKYPREFWLVRRA